MDPEKCHKEKKIIASALARYPNPSIPVYILTNEVLEKTCTLQAKQRLMRECRNRFQHVDTANDHFLLRLQCPHTLCLHVTI
jgi:hypothetical protein